MLMSGFTTSEDATSARIRELEEQLRASQLQVHELQDFLESAVEGLHMVGPDGIILWANQAELDMLGYSAEEYIGHNIVDFHVDLPVVNDWLRRLLGGETFYGERARLRRKDGTIRHVAVTSSGLFRGDTFVCTRCFTRDITEADCAEEQQARLAAIVESSDDAIISKDLEGVIQSWNPAAERMYGYTEQEVIGTSILRLVPLELYSEEDMILARIRAGQSIDHFATVRLAKGGRRLEVSITVSPVKNRAGEVVGASKIARDISAQLDVQRKKDQFLAILAHELRNPLAPVRNAIALFKQPNVTNEQRNRAQQIAERQTEHMARLLDDLMDVSRISSGRVELKKRSVELRPVVAQAADSVAALTEAKRHRLKVIQSPENIWLDADPVRIHQIVSNLLTNAAKYTDPLGHIELTTRSEGDYAVIEVRDNGIGFSPEIAPRLFMMFSQADGAATRSAGGLGIGLALVREFAERHGGTVSARSDGPLLGSVFTVRLPRSIP